MLEVFVEFTLSYFWDIVCLIVLVLVTWVVFFQEHVRPLWSPMWFFRGDMLGSKERRVRVPISHGIPQRCTLGLNSDAGSPSVVFAPSWIYWGCWSWVLKRVGSSCVLWLLSWQNDFTWSVHQLKSCKVEILHRSEVTISISMSISISINLPIYLSIYNISI